MWVAAGSQLTAWRGGGKPACSPAFRRKPHATLPWVPFPGSPSLGPPRLGPRPTLQLSRWPVATSKSLSFRPASVICSLQSPDCWRQDSSVALLTEASPIVSQRILLGHAEPGSPLTSVG